MKELKNGRSRLVRCNADRLKDILISRGLDPRDVASMLGYDRTYFGKVIRNGTIGVNCVKLLEDRLGIQPDAYEVIDPRSPDFSMPAHRKSDVRDKIISKRDNKKVDVKPIQIIAKAEIDPDQLKSLIKQAVLEAFEEL